MGLDEGCRASAGRVRASRLALRSGARMPTSVWNGSLSLGMVVVPVRLYPAIQKKTGGFRELDRGGRRGRHVPGSEPQPRVEAEPVGGGFEVPHRIGLTSRP